MVALMAEMERDRPFAPGTGRWVMVRQWHPRYCQCPPCVEYWRNELQERMKREVHELVEIMRNRKKT